MSASLLSLDATLIEQANNIIEIDLKDYDKIFEWAFEILEGKNIADDVAAFAQQKNVAPGKVNRISTAVSALLWECSKHINKDLSSLPQILQQVKFVDKLIPVFFQQYKSGRRRLLLLKGPLGLDALSYKDFVWRLDIEIAKRSMTAIAQPTFQIRLDLVNHAKESADPTLTPTSSEALKSFHLQTDYANLKHIQEQLQQALDEYQAVHSQRISRYIS